MATTADKRAWLAENGHPELDGGKGRLTRALEAEYDAAHPPADDYGPGTGAADFSNGDGQFERGWVGADDLPDQDVPVGNGVFATGFEDAPPQVSEERPSRPPRGRFIFGRTGTGRGSGGGKKTAGSTRPKRTFKRVSVAPLIEDAYADMAAAFGSIPPMARLLRAQAPLAGVILEPVVKDTVADRLLLQPAARNYDRLKVGTGLLGTPASLMAVLVTAPRPLGAKPVTDEAGNPVLDEAGQPVTAMTYEEPTLQHQSAMVSLRFCVRAMADAAGDSMTKVVERAAVSEEREQLVNEFLAYILGMPYNPDAADQRETARDRQAGLKLAGAAASAPEAA